MDLFERAGAQRICVQVRVRGDRIQMAGNVIAGLSLVVLPACARQGSNWSLVEPNQAVTVPICEENLDPGCEGVPSEIAGLISHTSGDPLENALVVLQTNELPSALETYSDENGVYRFPTLPSGAHTVQVLIGHAKVSRVVDLPAHARMRLDFRVNPGDELFRGMIVEPSPVSTSPSSTLIVR
jgi:hypothetical protein